ncbi:hypothetical protein [Haloarcula halophila]|uniref:hypothetical protein n=1 Tax=Haloarcula TaxID=2237 RepID=UPI0023E3C1A0|nr:hypothetical protein [Halomicroarcula sp. DFY41]
MRTNILARRRGAVIGATLSQFPLPSSSTVLALSALDLLLGGIAVYLLSRASSSEVR